MDGAKKVRAPLGMAYDNLASLMSFRGKYNGAEKLLRTGLRLKPIAYQYNGLASLLLRRAEKQSARRSGADAATASAAPPDAALLEEAATLLQRAIVHERTTVCAAGPPREPAYRENLAHVLSKLGRTDEAFWHAQLALDAASSVEERASAAAAVGVEAAADDWVSVEESRTIDTRLAAVAASCPRPRPHESR